MTTDHFAALLIALFGGSIASIAAGFFSRPKTRAEATQADASASVSLSADAREWAQLWMKKAEDAEARARIEAAKVEEVEARLDRLERILSIALKHLKEHRNVIAQLDGELPDLPDDLKEHVGGYV